MFPQQEPRSIPEYRPNARSMRTALCEIPREKFGASADAVTRPFSIVERARRECYECIDNMAVSLRFAFIIHARHAPLLFVTRLYQAACESSCAILAAFLLSHRIPRSH